MYLSKLELHGFKSFAERTVLHFDPGVTAIVGPNGCGKSNIVDAVRWVIGEQRARILRSDKMENVIFNGTAKKRPVGMAEVMLTIENTRSVLPLEYSEVTLGRRLFRSGDSEYLLNGVKCRLQDILDLFMDTGMGAGAYSVIELKMIEEILSENAHDRRRLFEEAAGITKYKLRRKQTLSKLHDTQADLTRLNDLTEEIGKLVRSLNKQAERASRYKEYESRLQSLELMLAQAEYNRLDGQQRQLNTEISSIRERIAAATERLAQGESLLDQLRRDLAAREQRLNTHRQRLDAHRDAVRTAEADVRLEQERLDAYGRDVERLVRERDETASRRTSLEATAARLRTELAGMDPAVEEAARLLAAAEQERDRTRAIAEDLRKQLQDLRRAAEAAEQEYVQRERSQERTASRMELLQQDRERYNELLAESTEKADELAVRLQTLQKQLEEAVHRRGIAQAELDEATAARDAIRTMLDEALEALRQVERRRETAAAEMSLLESLVASYEEFAGPVQYLASSPGWSAAPLRTVSDFLTCPPDIRPALEAALGDFASCIVVESEVEARNAMAALRQEGRGQAAFLILERLHMPAPSPGQPGNALLHSIDVVDPRYRPVAEVLLSHWYLVNTLEEAQSATTSATGPARFVTPSGEWAAPSGLVKGGGEGEASPVAARLARREQLEATRTLLAGLDNDAFQRRAEAERFQKELEAVSIDARRESLVQAQQAFAETERLLERTRVEYAALAQRRNEAESRIRSIDADLDVIRQQVEERAEDLKASNVLDKLRTQRSALEEQFQQADEESRTAMTRYNEAHMAAFQTRSRQENVRKDLDRSLQQLDDLTSRSASRDRDLASIQEQIRSARERMASLQRRLSTLQEQRPELEAAVAGAEAEAGQVRSTITGNEANLRRLRQEREDRIRDEHQRDIRLTETHTRIEDLGQNILEHFGRSLADDPVSFPPDFDEPPVRSEVLDLRNKIKALGAVNALALEEYGVEKERYDFLVAQQQDLQQAETSLLDTIYEINTTASERFMTTYEAIRANFQRIFIELFGEDASADLELIEPADPLESPIEIMAKPRGKRPSTIAQLSGGEKTLTAIALLFAIYLVKPSPFCILDEVDAPLDDANVDRFMHLIREFSDSTQFILVTHNKRTMELADRMYGITMQEQGVSKIVAVEFGNLEPSGNPVAL
jgi:chromosome segregation protein